MQLQLFKILCCVRNNVWPGKTWRKRCMSSRRAVSCVIFAMWMFLTQLWCCVSGGRSHNVCATCTSTSSDKEVLGLAAALSYCFSAFLPCQLCPTRACDSIWFQRQDNCQCSIYGAAKPFCSSGQPLVVQLSSYLHTSVVFAEGIGHFYRF